MKARRMQAYMLAILGLSLFGLLAVSAFEILPITSGNNDFIITQQANFQLARAEFLVKDVYILAYRGDTARAQAVSELQIQLPAFERVQAGLANGDPTLGLPNNPSAGVKQALLSANADYLALDAAIKAILASPEKAPDLVQVTIVAQHERPYLAAMYPVTTLLQQEAQTRSIQFLVIKMALIGLVFVLIIVKYTAFTQKVIAEMIEEEEIANEI